MLHMDTSESKYLIGISPPVTLRHDLRPGDLGSMVTMHGRIYAEECGYNLAFEAYVCKTFYEYAKSSVLPVSKFWLIEAGDTLVGTTAIVAAGDNRAQLRWLLVEPEFRKHHLGSFLFGQAIEYCRQMNYREVFLNTTIEQKTALSMYEKAGFVLDHMEEYQSEWGHPIQERVYVLSLTKQLSLPQA